MTADNIKKRIRDRDGNRCTKCGMTNDEHKLRYKGRHGGLSLNVHRPDEVAPYSLNNGVTLCCACHMQEHAHRPKRTPGYKQRGYNGHSKTRTHQVGPLWLKPDQYDKVKLAAESEGLHLTQLFIKSAFNDDGTLTADFLKILSETS